MRKRHPTAVLSIVASLFALLSQACAEGRGMPITARDCVMVRYITGVWMSPQGTRVAYLVKLPNLKENRNDYQIWIKGLRDSTTNSGTLLFSGSDISAVKWSGDGSHLAMLIATHEAKSLVSVNVETGAQETILPAIQDISDYSLDKSGNVIAYTVLDKEGGDQLKQKHNREDLENGYSVGSNEASPSSTTNTYSVYIKRRQMDGAWSIAEAVNFDDPFTHKRLRHLIGPILYLTLSPDGERLALNYWTDSPLSAWERSPWVRLSLSQNSRNRIMVVHNLRSHSTSLGFQTVYPDSAPLWSSDSRSFLMNAHSPVGSVWEDEDIRDHRTAGLDANLFWVDAESGKTEEVFRHPADHHEAPMTWRPDGDVVVHMVGNVVARFHRNENSWSEIERIKVPGTPADKYWYLNSNGAFVVGVHQTLNTPEDLFVYRTTQKAITIITDLNPQLKSVTFAPVRQVSWKTPEGFKIDGFLFLPTNYIPGKRYPLVIQTKGDQGQFTCDSGANHDPSFAPQPIANAGIMYLTRTADEDYNQQDENDTLPKGYPGQLNVPAHEMEIWDSAITYLDEEGIVDPKKVGIIGFSATGYYVEFALVHSRFRYAAATAADNTQRSFSDYWLFPTSMSGLDAVYGGPPHGPTLNNWLAYSISFNLDKIHTPLLIESMGYGIHDDVKGSIPINLASRLEVFTGLSRMGKPVALYYYPDENHTPDHPKARLASLQRNVDWYRFWLQGYERPNLEDPEQYKRWEHLRELRDADVKAEAQTQADSPKSN